MPMPLSAHGRYLCLFHRCVLMDAHSVLADSGMTALAVAATTALLAATKACSRRNPGAASRRGQKKTKPTVDGVAPRAKMLMHRRSRTPAHASEACWRSCAPGGMPVRRPLPSSSSMRRGRALPRGMVGLMLPRRTHCSLAGLQFVLKRELEGEEIRLAHIGTNPIVPAPKAP